VTGQSNVNTTRDNLDTPLCTEGIAKSGVWYKFSLAFPARIEVSTCNQANFDTLIFVYGGACGSLLCEAEADETSDCGSHTTRVVDDVLSRNIYILVNGYEGETGNFDLTVSVTAIPPPVSSGVGVGGTNGRRMTC